MIFSPPVIHPRTDVKVVLWSGLSDPTDCALSRTQLRFLDQLAVPDESKIYANFPYIKPVRSEQAAIPIVHASWRNLSQFLNARHSPYRDHAVKHWEALARSCRGLLVITISCGLEILNAALSSGVRPEVLEVLALGPVARRRPDASHLLVRGGRDYVLNPFFRDVDLVVPDIGHMDYLEHPTILELTNGQLQKL
ncbi:MAG: hypothetical protein WCJ09_28895 [Planctomycetota bacterium]